MSYDWIRNKTNSTVTIITVRVALITFMSYDWIRNKTNSTGTTIGVHVAQPLVFCAAFCRSLFV